MTLDLHKYLSLFVAEAGEHLAAFAKDLVRLEEAARQGGGDGATDAIDSCFRHAHSVKGMSASMQLEAIAALAHRAEDLVDVFRKRPGAPRRRARSTSCSPPATCSQEMVGRPRRAARARRRTPRRWSGSPRPPAALPRRRARGPPPRTPRRPARRARRRRRARGGAAAARAARRRRAAAGACRWTSRSPASCPVPGGARLPRREEARRRSARSRASTPVGRRPQGGPHPGEEARGRCSRPPRRSRRSSARSRRSPTSPRSTLREAERGAPAPARRPPRAARAAPRARGGRAPCACAPRSSTASSTRWASSSSRPPASARWARRCRRARAAPLDEGVDRLHAIVKDLHDKVMTVRMTPLALVTERLPRAARDVARKLGQAGRGRGEGGRDRARPRHPRGALRPAPARAAQRRRPRHRGRRTCGSSPASPPPAASRSTARRERDRVILEIADDGKGMDPAKLRAAAVARGALDAEAGGGARRPRGAAARLPARASRPRRR